MPREIRRKEIIKIRTELNDIEIKRTIQRINKSRSGSLKRKIELTKLSPDSSRQKKKGIKFKKSEMKEKLQPRLQKYKRL